MVSDKQIIKGFLAVVGLVVLGGFVGPALISAKQTELVVLGFAIYGGIILAGLLKLNHVLKDKKK